MTNPYEGPIVTLKEAIKSGARYYFTGKPCKKGHLAQSLTSNWKCRECVRLAKQAKKATLDAGLKVRDEKFAWHNYSQLEDRPEGETMG